MAVQVLAPTTGIVIEIKVSKGVRVSTDDELVIIESMKMHIPVTAPDPGTVEDVLVGEGQQVSEDDPVVIIS